jgi:hypothetical protein
MNRTSRALLTALHGVHITMPLLPLPSLPL